MKRFDRILLALLVALAMSAVIIACGDDNGDLFLFAGDDDDDEASGEVWTDPSSGLMWQNGDDCCYEWDKAKGLCQNSNWGGYGDWRLPTISELRSLIRGCSATEADGSCGVTDSCLDSDCWNGPCDGCPGMDGPGTGGRYWPAGLAGDGYWYWSSSTVADDEPYAWSVDFDVGRVNTDIVYDASYVRCVR